MKLYYAPGTCALACWIVLEWIGQPYEAVRVDYKSPEYLKVNPLGMVPALDIGEPRALTQAVAILEYLADLHPDLHLGAVDTPREHAALQETMSFLSGDLHPAFWPYFAPQRYTVDASESAIADVQKASLARIDRAATHLDDLLAGGVHLYHNRRSIADALAFVMMRWTQRLEKPWSAYPHVARFMQAMDKDPAVRKVLALSANAPA